MLFPRIFSSLAIVASCGVAVLTSPAPAANPVPEVAKRQTPELITILETIVTTVETATSLIGALYYYIVIRIHAESG